MFKVTEKGEDESFFTSFTRLGTSKLHIKQLCYFSSFSKIHRRGEYLLNRLVRRVKSWEVLVISRFTSALKPPASSRSHSTRQSTGSLSGSELHKYH